MKKYLELIAYGFLLGFGYMIAEDLWHSITGLVGICRG